MHCFSLTAIYLLTKFHFNSFCNFPRYMEQTGIHYEKVNGYGEITLNIQGRITVFVHCPSSYCRLYFSFYTARSLIATYL